MASFAEGKIAFVGPQELGAADNLEDVIVAFSAGAKDSLDIAVQELDSVPIAQAILDARWRSVRVRIVLEQDYLEDEELPKVELKPGETAEQARVRAQWSEDPPRELDINRDILTAHSGHMCTPARTTTRRSFTRSSSSAITAGSGWIDPASQEDAPSGKEIGPPFTMARHRRLRCPETSHRGPEWTVSEPAISPRA